MCTDCFPTSTDSFNIDTMVAYSSALSILLAGIVASTAANAQEQLPITTTDVFIQSGEVSESSINIMARCNNEESSSMKLLIDGSESATADVDSSTDFTHTFVVENLSSNSAHTYKVMCGDLESAEGSFNTAPGPDDAVALSFVWAADLAGQGYGRNPDFEVKHADGSTMKGGYIVFETMEKLAPDFALFQGKLVLL